MSIMHLLLESVLLSMAAVLMLIILMALLEFISNGFVYAIEIAIMKIKFHGDYDAYCKWAEEINW